MSSDTIRFEIHDQVGWIRIQRAHCFNALDLDTMQALFDIANRCSSDQRVRCVVIRGDGDKAFCAGGDVAGFEAAGDDVPVLLREMTTYYHAALSRFSQMNAPVIASVNGVAAGAGIGLVAMADLALSVPGASFTSAYTLIGLSPDGSSTWYLSRLIGERRAKELFLTNRTLSAAEALDWGLINRVVDTGDSGDAQQGLDDATAELALRIASGPTRAFGHVKALMQRASTDTLESQMEAESRAIAELSLTRDGREGVAAFVGKRKPAFTGE